MGRPSGPKTRNGETWTEAKFVNFVKNQLRRAKWPPIFEVKKEANVSRGVYLCAGCDQHVPPTIKQGRKRVNNIFVDHIIPVIDPTVGFVGWDSFIDRLFCEKDNLQLLCGECHDAKTAEERRIAVETRQANKEKQ